MIPIVTVVMIVVMPVVVVVIVPMTVVVVAVAVVRVAVAVIVVVVMTGIVIVRGPMIVVMTAVMRMNEPQFLQCFVREFDVFGIKGCVGGAIGLFQRQARLAREAGTGFVFWRE
ncbi:MAG: hypothetical protein ACK5Q5_05310, partial [Planctomycetaceae bacterium]